MIDLHDTNFQESFRNVSIDTDNDEPMTFSNETVINFDKVKDCYVQVTSIIHTPKSADALFIKDEEYYFIEFKNGAIAQRHVYEVVQKAYDSMLMLLDIKEKTTSFSREKVHYILVYNYDKNKKEINKQAKSRVENRDGRLLEDEIQDSSSFQDIVLEIGGYSKRNVDVFGLRKKLGDFFMKDVKTYKQSEFEQCFIETI